MYASTFSAITSSSNFEKAHTNEVHLSGDTVVFFEAAVAYMFSVDILKISALTSSITTMTSIKICPRYDQLGWSSAKSLDA